MSLIRKYVRRSFSPGLLGEIIGFKMPLIETARPCVSRRSVCLRSLRYGNDSSTFPEVGYTERATSIDSTSTENCIEILETIGSDEIWPEIRTVSLVPAKHSMESGLGLFPSTEIAKTPAKKIRVKIMSGVNVQR